jgi:hypothetical protein
MFQLPKNIQIKLRNALRIDAIPTLVLFFFKFTCMNHILIKLEAKMNDDSFCDALP